MGRGLNFVSATVALSIFAPAFGFTQGPARGGRHGRGLDLHQNAAHGPAVRERFQQLSPEERQVFRRNAERWLQMNPEQQKLLRERYKIHHQQLQKEADTALRQSGLRLDQNARDQFQARYLQERIRMERALREQFQAKRDQELPQLNERLKNEFQLRQSTPAAKPSLTPAASVTPNH